MTKGLSMGTTEAGGLDMKKITVVVAVMAVVTLLTPMAASADPPIVWEDEFVEELPFGYLDADGEWVWVCGFPVFGENTIAEKITTYLNKDGSLRRARLHLSGSTLWTNESGDEVWENWAWTGTYDPDTETFTQTGILWNAHMGAGGILVHDSGRVVLDVSAGPDVPGTPLVVNGPHQALEGDFSGLCGALA